MFTLEDDCKTLQEVLVRSKNVNWNCSLVLYAIQSDQYLKVQEALTKTSFRYHNSTPCNLWWMPKEEAALLEYSCPDEVYVSKLDPVHGKIIDDNWPFSFPESDSYFAKMIEKNGGCGVFLKTDGSLVAWVVHNLIGLGALQTLEQYKRKGYGSLALIALSKHLGEIGIDPVGSVLCNNVISQALFKKIGFRIAEGVVFSENQERRSLGIWTIGF